MSKPRIGAKIPMEDVERAHVLAVLKSCRGNVSAAAKVLHMGRQTLYDKLKAYADVAAGCKK